MRTSIRIARDSFLASLLVGLAAFALGSRLLASPGIAAWIAGGFSLLAAAGAAAWLVERRVARPLDGLTRTLMQSGGSESLPPPSGGDIDEIHDLTAALQRFISGTHDRVARGANERDRLIEIMDAMPVGLFELDRRGRIVFQNRVLREQLGTDDRSIGRTPVEVIRSGELQKLVDTVQAERRGRSVDLTIVEPVRRHLTVHALPVENGLIVIAEDMTRVRQLEKARSEMVSNIGHELRTPLSAILGYLETLEQSPDLSPEDRSRFVAVITRNSKRLERLVRDLSRLSRLESNPMPLELEPLDVASVAGGVLETLAPRTQSGGIEIRTEIPPTLPPIRADRDGLETVLLNLLDNAVRATPPGGTITVGAQERDDQIRLWVEDTGPGIPGDLRERVFERFYRIDAGRSPGEGGTGLGLAIVKHTVHQYGGRIRVEAGERGGARVVISLPRGNSKVLTDK